ncbi:hypothetical protein [Kitasatospora viridis]|uniref:Uncharacterized protein n=1 Tax=Kitasatospora viridis TaxID=281105 RepID=A0A561SDY5_9ACTN|nr:hypothetical protein [Kitasatospora viridis]TWF73058.1 hypothetical protein FHX73_16209 [Kitasatospora viridis]
MTVQDTSTAGRTRHGDFAELHRRVSRARLLRDRPLSYAARSAALPAVLGLLLAGFDRRGAGWAAVGGLLIGHYRAVAGVLR